MRGLLFLSCAVILSACSTVPSNSYNQVQPILSNKHTVGDSVIIVRRDSGVMGSACPIEVYLDGEKFAKLKPKESIDINTSAGTHILSAKFTGSGFCQDRLNEIEVVIKPHEKKYYRLAMGASGDFNIFPTLENPIQ